MKHLESKLQAACIKWFRYEYNKYKDLYWATPNGGARTTLQGVILKREGVIAGNADTFLAVAKGGYHGFFIEFKIVKGKQSDPQKNFQQAVEGQGYKYEIIRTFEDFTSTVKQYLNS